MVKWLILGIAIGWSVRSIIQLRWNGLFIRKIDEILNGLGCKHEKVDKV